MAIATCVATFRRQTDQQKISSRLSRYLRRWVVGESAEGGTRQDSAPRIARIGSIPRSLPMPHLLLCPLTAKLTAKPFEGSHVVAEYPEPYPYSVNAIIPWPGAI